jgi:hypothetical protein
MHAKRDAFKLSMQSREGHATANPLHFVGLAISACPFTRPSCTADSSAALRDTAPCAPVQSSVHVWPFSLQPLLPLPFPAPPLLDIFCAHFTFHHSLSCPISNFPPRFPNAFLTALCPFWNMCCMATGVVCLPLFHLPFWRCCWNRLIPKSPHALQSDISNFCACHLCIIRKLIKSTYGPQNQLSAKAGKPYNIQCTIYSI